MLTSYVLFHKTSLLLLVTSALHDRGTWKTSTFKKYNFDAEGIPTNGGALHPLLKVREEIRDIFLEMGSVNYERGLNITNSDLGN
jgi:phenylalanyl-tRNA synthetase alpha subunit